MPQEAGLTTQALPIQEGTNPAQNPGNTSERHGAAPQAQIPEPSAEKSPSASTDKNKTLDTPPQTTASQVPSAEIPQKAPEPAEQESNFDSPDHEKTPNTGVFGISYYEKTPDQVTSKRAPSNQKTRVGNDPREIRRNQQRQAQHATNLGTLEVKEPPNTGSEPETTDHSADTSANLENS